MSACEKCWSDAYVRAQLEGGTQVEHYKDLLAERKDTPCSPEDQSGEGSRIIDLMAALKASLSGETADKQDSHDD